MGNMRRSDSAGEALVALIATCAKQHCAALRPDKPRACGASNWPRAHRSQVWSELHARIMHKRFEVNIEVTPDIVAAHKALGDDPTPQQLAELVAQFARNDTARRSEPGSHIVVDIVARLIAGVVLPSEFPSINLADLPTRKLPDIPEAPSGIAVLVTPMGYRIATGTGDDITIAMCSTGDDFAALTEALCAVRKRSSKFADGNMLTIAPEQDVSYQRIISAMDAAQHAGFDAELMGVSELEVALSRRTRAFSPAVPCSRSPMGCAGPGRPNPVAELQMEGAPVVSVSETGIAVNTQPVVVLEDLPPPPKPIAALHKLLVTMRQREAKTTVAILQVDKDTTAGRIRQVTETVNAAGFPNVLFAVNSDRNGRSGTD